MMSVTLFENSNFFNCTPKIVSYDPYEDTLETLVENNYSTIDKKHLTLACGTERFLDFKTPISACLQYGRSISIYNNLINLIIKPNIDELLPIQVQIDSREFFNEIVKQVRTTYRIGKFKLGFNGEELENRYTQIKEYSLQNHSIIDLYINPSDFDTREDLFRIWIIPMSGDDIELYVHKMDTLFDLKQKIFDCTQIPIDLQRLLFNYTRLVGDETLCNLNITKDSQIMVVVPQCGGGNFVDFEKSRPRVFGWSKSGPKWRTVKAGLCFEGRCLNLKCKAFNRMVIINMGTPIIYQLGMPNQVETKCPKCDSLVQPKTCAFNNCKWRFYGVKQTPTGPKRVNCEWKNVGDEYHRFDDDEESFCEWNSLVIETSYLSKWSASRSFEFCKDKTALTKSDICAICLDDNNDKMYKLDCKHEFHVCCFKEWIKYTPSPNCPLCRNAW